MSSNTNQNIYPKSCVYNCGIQIFWNTATSEYWEVFTKKHICPNRVKKQGTSNTSATAGVSSKPIYYNKKPWSTTPKQKTSNSVELLTGPIDAIQKKYETLSDIVSEYNGKVHGSQRDRDPKRGLLDLLVYYEVPLGKGKKSKENSQTFFLRVLVERTINNNNQIIIQ
jgi:hypothetical protein